MCTIRQSCFFAVLSVAAILTTSLSAQDTPAPDAQFFEVIKTDDVDGIDLMEDFRHAVFAHKGAGRVSVWDIIENKEVASIETPSPSCVLARGASIYVGNEGDGLVTVFNGANKWQKTAEVKLPAVNLFSLSAPGGKAFKGQLLVLCNIDLKNRQPFFVDTKSKKSMPLGAPGDLTGGAVDFDGKYFFFQGGGGSPARPIGTSKSWPMLLAGRNVDVYQAQYDTLPIIRQVQSGPFWIGGHSICKGAPPKPFGGVRDQFVIPDRRKQLAYVFPDRTRLEAVELKGTLASLGTRNIFFPKEHGRFIEMNPHVTCFYDYLSFAVTGDDNKLRIYSYDGKQKLVWSVTLEGFQGDNAAAQKEPPQVASNTPQVKPTPPKPAVPMSPVRMPSVPMPQPMPVDVGASAAENFVNEELTKELKEHLEDPDEAHLAEYVRLTKNSEARVRRQAVAALGELPLSDQVYAAIFARVGDPDPKVRAAVAGTMAYSEMEGAAAIKVAEKLLADPVPDVQSIAVMAASTVGKQSPSTALAMAKLLPTADDDTCHSILRSLGDMVVPADAAPLIKAAYPQYKEATIVPLTRISPPPQDLIPWLRQIMASDEFYKVTEEAAIALGRLGDADYLIAEAKKTGDPRKRALQGLGGLARPNPEANQLLIAAMTDKDVTVRIAATWGAGRQLQPDPGVLLALFNACDDADGSVRQQCRNSIEFLILDQASLKYEDAISIIDKGLAASPNDVGLLLAKAYVMFPRAASFSYIDKAKSLELYNTATAGIVKVVLKSELKLMPFEKEEFGGIFYEAAVVACVTGNKPLALKYLQAAFENGYKQWDAIEENPDLEAIRKEDGYKQLIAKYKK